MDVTLNRWTHVSAGGVSVGAAGLPAGAVWERCVVRGRELFIDNLLVRIYYIIVMIQWAGLAAW